jgi:aryl-alcohol dehydrogenase-like predicted oxidoreductase
MQYRPLGASGISVSRVALGCGNFGGIGSAPAFFGGGESREEAFALMDAARRLGITLFDTADAYGGGRSERWIGDWLRERGDEEVVLTTKVFYSVEGDPDDRGLAPERIQRQFQGSLERLGVERVDLYLTHAPDPETPLERTLEALDELRTAGRVRAIGLSNVGARELETALGHTRIDCVQNSYSLLDRDVEAEVLPLCERHGIAFAAFGPLAGGWLTGKYRRGERPPEGSRMGTRPEGYRHLETAAVYDGLELLAAAATERGVDLATLALAWLLGESRVTCAIVGPRRPEQLEPARAAFGLELSPDEREELASLFP